MAYQQPPEVTFVKSFDAQLSGMVLRQNAPTYINTNASGQKVPFFSNFITYGHMLTDEKIKAVKTMVQATKLATESRNNAMLRACEQHLERHRLEREQAAAHALAAEMAEPSFQLNAMTQFIASHGLMGHLQQHVIGGAPPQFNGNAQQFPAPLAIGSSQQQVHQQQFEQLDETAPYDEIDPYDETDERNYTFTPPAGFSPVLNLLERTSVNRVKDDEKPRSGSSSRSSSGKRGRDGDDAERPSKRREEGGSSSSSRREREARREREDRKGKGKPVEVVE